MRLDVDDGGSFGQLVKRRRKGLGLTQGELARQTGYSVSAIRKVEGDELRPSQPLAKTLAEHLNVAPEQRVHFVRFARDQLGPNAWEGPDRDRVFAAPCAMRRPVRLPVQPAPLIGREKQVWDGQALLRQDSIRLLVLTGPPGVGKTHLSLRLASDLSADFDDIVFVALAQINDPGLVISAIAQAIGVTETGPRPILETVRDHLRDARVMLVLDNFEQVMAAAPTVADLLAAAPHLKVLVTSREVLHLRGEQDYPVPPLSLPALSFPDGATEWETVGAAGAVRLFVARAQGVRPNFALTRENAATIASICHYLDGLPLAIELAAARIRALPPQALLAHLADRLNLLTGGARDMPPHQQTLRGAIAWSYDLLDENDKKLFRRLAVFVGGCTLEAAESVCLGFGGHGSGPVDDAPRSGPDEPSGPTSACDSYLPAGQRSTLDILDGLTALVDKSLLRQDFEDGGEARFTMLETIRQFARERLDATSEGRVTQQRHLDWYVQWAERAERELRGANQVKWLSRFAGDHNNVREALSWSLDNDPAAGLRVASDLCPYWRRRGQFAEAHRWLPVLLARTSADRPGANPTADRLVRARALFRAGNLAIAEGDHRSASQLLEESLTIFREVGDHSGIACALRELGRNQVITGGDPEEIGRLLEESLKASRASDKPDDVALTLGYLGELAMTQHDNRLARDHIAASLAAFQRGDDLWGINWCRINLGFLDLLAGDTVHSRAQLTMCLDLAGRLGARQHLGVVFLGMAGLSRLDGDAGRALALFRDSVWLFREVGTPAVYDALSFLGEFAAKQHDYVRSVRLFAAGTRRHTPYVPIVCSVYSAACHPEWEACLSTARSALGEDVLAAAWAEGEAMALDQAVTYALAGSKVDSPIVEER